MSCMHGIVFGLDGFNLLQDSRYHLQVDVPRNFHGEMLEPLHLFHSFSMHSLNSFDKHKSNVTLDLPSFSNEKCNLARGMASISLHFACGRCKSLTTCINLGNVDCGRPFGKRNPRTCDLVQQCK